MEDGSRSIFDNNEPKLEFGPDVPSAPEFSTDTWGQAEKAAEAAVAEATAQAAAFEAQAAEAITEVQQEAHEAFTGAFSNADTQAQEQVPPETASQFGQQASQFGQQASPFSQHAYGYNATEAWQAEHQREQARM
ncbi:MAG: hypothetical protein IJM69_05325, partial [Firmicutes bacterium]|nr:hypothetical protein [Bacillota bacterium]